MVSRRGKQLPQLHFSGMMRERSRVRKRSSGAPSLTSVVITISPVSPERFETYKGPLAIAVRKGLADGTVDPAADIKQLYYNAYDSILGMMQRLTVGVPSVNELDAHTRLRAMCAMFTREFAAKKD